MDPSHLRELSEIIGHKWDLVILARLAERPLRYMELAHEVRAADSDLTEGVLSKNLRRLVSGGLISKEPIDRHHHAYALTPHGRRIVAILAQITALSDRAPPETPEDDDDADN